MRRPFPLAVALLAGCPKPAASTLAFDQAPAITVEAGESVNLSVAWSDDPPDDPSLAWSASCGQIMGLFVRGSYLAPDAATDCTVTATSLADPAISASLDVAVTAPDGGGAVRWTRHVASDQNDAVRRLAPTPDGGVIALVETWGDYGGAGLGDLDVVVAKFDAAGEEVWTTPLATATREFAGDVAVAPDGTTWVVATTYGALDGASLGEADVALAKLTADGDVAWIAQFGTDRSDNGTAVALAADGDVVVAGWTEGDLAGALGNADGFVRRVSPDGEVRWTRQFGGTGIDFVIGVAADGDDFVAVGTTDGEVASPSMGGQDAYLARFDADGAPVDVAQYGFDTDDRAYGIAARPGGGVVLAGAYGADGFVAALDRAGDADWSYAIATPGEDLAQAVAVAPDGAVSVVGSTTGDLGTPNVGFFDAFVVQLDASGAPAWTRRLGSAADDYGWALARLPDGDAVIGGRTDGLLADAWGLGGDGYLRRLGP